MKRRALDTPSVGGLGMAALLQSARLSVAGPVHALTTPKTRAFAPPTPVAANGERDQVLVSA
ncbi:MAG: hypothetical protein AB1673_13505 [Actinomycetota bacterium]